MSLSLEDLHKSYGTTRAVDGVSLTVAEGETLALLGPSGCGKSTLLRLVAGLEQPDRGRVVFDGVDITAQPPQRRRFGVVFQDYALFPHLDVAGNVAFGLVEQGVPRAARDERVARLLDLVGLGGLQGRRVHQLSGGQQQRVALARAVSPGPQVLLLDEPLSNLDEALRNDLKLEIVRLLHELRIEAVYVTHDQAEAFAVADKVAVMREGRIVQVGDREQLLERPVDAWTARFLGHDNVWEGEDAERLAKVLAATVAPGLRLAAGDALLLRADLVELSGVKDAATEAGPAQPKPGSGEVLATVTRAEREGLAWRLSLSVPAWGSDVQWHGHSRELVGPSGRASAATENEVAVLPAPGRTYSLRAPGTAWRTLASGRP